MSKILFTAVFIFSSAAFAGYDCSDNAGTRFTFSAQKGAEFQAADFSAHYRIEGLAQSQAAKTPQGYRFAMHAAGFPMGKIWFLEFRETGEVDVFDAYMDGYTRFSYKLDCQLK